MDDLLTHSRHPLEQQISFSVECGVPFSFHSRPASLPHPPTFLFQPMYQVARASLAASVKRHRPFSSSFVFTRSLMSQYFAEKETPYSRLEAKPYFESLSDREKHYAHYMSRASFEGTRIIIDQTNPNAMGIYDLILQVFGNGNHELVDIKELEAKR